MKKVIAKVNKYDAECSICKKKIPIYLMLPDFGDPPIIKKCKCCETLYWYTPDEDYYLKPYEKQIEGKRCEICNANLSENLVLTHKHIKCCGMIFSLDDNFIESMRIDSPLEKIEVYLIYS